VKRRSHHGSRQESATRYYGTERGPSSQLREELAREHVKDLSNQQKAKKEAKAIDKVQRP
jgi:amino-acid N-acetyltransferase